MAIRAIDLDTLDATVVERPLATVTAHPSSRATALAAARRERRRWAAGGVVLFGAPLVGCLCVLGVVR